MDYRFRFDIVWTNIGYLLDGLGMTLVISLVSLLASIVVGLIVALGRRSRTRWISFPAATYCELFRDTPVLVQLFWVYYVLPVLTGVRLSAFTAVVIGLSLNSGAFLAEIFRAGIQAVPRGQIDAARVLGMNRTLTMRRIVLPQAIRIVLPPMGNDFVALIKFSSLASTFAVGEITRKATELSSFTFRPIEIFTFIALVYFFICWPLSMSIRYLEKRVQVA
jgi:His/Glu/Gln/Arg/opine family amino acid ABC transporter permease subunit